MINTVSRGTAQGDGARDSSPRLVLAIIVGLFLVGVVTRWLHGVEWLMSR